MNEIEIKDFIDHAHVGDLADFGSKFDIEMWNNHYASYKEAVYRLCTDSEKITEQMVAEVRHYP